MQNKILNKRYHIYYFASAIIGGISMLWGVMIFRITLISFMIPILILIAVGTIAFFMDRARYRSTYETNWPDTFAWLQNIISWGFIGCTIFLVSNKYLATSEITISEYRIDNVSTISGYPRIKSNEIPLKRIDYNGKIRELVFSSKYLNKLEDYKTVTLKTKNGFWGYEVIEEQTLNE